MSEETEDKFAAIRAALAALDHADGSRPSLGDMTYFSRTCEPAAIAALIAAADRAKELEAAFSAACAFIDSHAADPDITPEMCRAYDEFTQRRAAIDRASGAST